LKRLYNPKQANSFNGLKNKESENLNSLSCQENTIATTIMNSSEDTYCMENDYSDKASVS
jgi:hypothetical protein